MASLVPAFQLSARAAAAAAGALVATGLLGLPTPLYAMIAAVIVTDLSPVRTRELAVPRIVGTVLGASLGALASPWMAGEAWGVALGIFAAMFVSHLLQTSGAAKLAGYVCAIVLLTHGQDPWAYAVDRFVETLVGIVAAVLVSLVPKMLDPKEPPKPAS